MFARLCVVGILILGYVEGALGQKDCRHCVPYTYCAKALELVDRDKNNSAVRMFAKSSCGMHKGIVKVCCSEISASDLPDFDSRLRVTESPNIELPIIPSTTKLLQQNPNERKPESSTWSYQMPPTKQGRPDNGLLPETCGTIAVDRIIGGTEADLFEFPWMVLIAYGDSYKFACAGSLINSRYVLTAAHCVVNMDYKFARIGEFDLKTDIDCQGNRCEKKLQNIEIEYDIVHDDYDLTSYKNDIALLRLKHAVEMPLNNANSVCLPTTTEMQRQSITNKIAKVAGWGLTEFGKQFTKLRKVSIPVRSSSICSDYYSHLSERDSNQFCAGVLNKDSCRGDSGGPLVIETTINNQIKYVQYGIISHGKEQCGTSAPGIYTDVRKYMNWIQNNIRS